MQPGYMLTPAHPTQSIVAIHARKTLVLHCINGSYMAKLVLSLQVLIPVCGSKLRGQVRYTATVRNGKWELDRVACKFKDRPEAFTILDSQRTRVN